MVIKGPTGRRRGRPPLEAGSYPWKQPHKKPRTASSTLRQLFEVAEEMHITISHQASLVCLSRTAIHNWRAGHSLPDIMTVEAFADALGLEIVLRPKPAVNKK